MTGMYIMGGKATDDDAQKWLDCKPETVPKE
jgi:hypothetical protein